MLITVNVFAVMELSGHVTLTILYLKKIIHKEMQYVTKFTTDDTYRNTKNGTPVFVGRSPDKSCGDTIHRMLQ